MFRYSKMLAPGLLADGGHRKLMDGKTMNFYTPALQFPTVTLRLSNVGNQTIFVHFDSTETLNNGIPILAGDAKTFGYERNILLVVG